MMGQMPDQAVVHPGEPESFKADWVSTTELTYKQ